MGEENLITPVPAPPLNIPDSSSTVDVQVVDSTCRIVTSTRGMIAPTLPGHTIVNVPNYSFLIKNHALGKSILFDLGGRKDWWNLSPRSVYILEEYIPGLSVEKGVHEVLVEGGVELESIDAVVWSHWHWDHCGDVSKFPKSTVLVYGLGTESVLPGYPAKEDSPVLESDFQGRNAMSIDFEGSSKIGQFRYHDFFGDGSFYLLDTPGHAAGHISGLARTSPTTFVFMGGDICHFGGLYRPTTYVPLPSTLPYPIPRYPFPCPCTPFTDLHPHPESSRTTPFFKVPEGPKSYHGDPPLAQKSVDTLADFDGNENVLVCLAHDIGLKGVVDFFPEGDGFKDWKGKGWKEKTHWQWLANMPVGGKNPEEPCAPKPVPPK